MNDGEGDPSLLEIQLSSDEVGTLMAALRRYLSYWEQHLAEDPESMHRLQAVERIRYDVGRMLWRLETLLIPTSGSRVQYSSQAVDPDGAIVGTDWVIGDLTGWTRRPWPGSAV